MAVEKRSFSKVPNRRHYLLKTSAKRKKNWHFETPQRQNRTVIGNKKWVHYDNLKRRKSWGMSGHVSMSTARPNTHGAKVMLCNWWDQLGYGVL